MRPGRVLCISNFFPPNDFGGAEIAAYNGCYGLKQRGVDVSVLTVFARWTVEWDRWQELHGIPIHQIAYPPLHLADPSARDGWLASLRRGWSQTLDRRIDSAVEGEIRRLRPDVVHIHNVSGGSLSPFVACRRLQVPVVLTLHDHWLLCPNNMLYQGAGRLCDPARSARGCERCFRRYDFWADIPWRRQVFRRLVRDVRLMISPSQKLVDLHVAAGYDRARFRVVPYGIQPGLAAAPADPRARRIAREVGLYHTLLFAGATVETKGIEVLIEAFSRLRESDDRLRLVVAGAGDEQMMAALRGLGPAVQVLGRLPFDEMRALYATADLTVVPSIWYDNSPMVIYESFFAGTPVVASNIGGIPELVEDGVTGCLVPPGDAAALARGVSEHLQRPAPERRAMRRRCAIRGRRGLGIERHVDGLLDVYREAMNG